MLRAHASPQCGPCSDDGVDAVDAICGLSLLLVLFLAPGGFSPGTQVFCLLKNPSKFQFDLESSRRRTTKWMSSVLNRYQHLFICLFDFLFSLKGGD